MVQGFFLEIGAVIILAAVLGAVFRRLNQPLLLAYIMSGLILGASFLNVISFKELLGIFSDLGIAFLLFLVGINLDLKIFKEVGKTSLVTGIGQMVFTTLLGLALSFMLGFGLVESLYISIALTFSSTIIIVKVLSDKKEINSLYGKISVGFLLMQDLVAIVALVLISSLSFSSNFQNQLATFITNIVLLFMIFYFARKFLVERLFKELSKNQELQFLGAIAWCFAFTSLAIILGFSKEIGAFLAGVSIASLPYNYNILGKVKYLRDFFIVLFFVVLGSNFVLASSQNALAPAIIFSLFVLIGDPLIVFALMIWLGYKGRTSFLAGLTVAQISEFSLILVFLGESLGHISKEIVSIVTLVAIITISISTYLLSYSNRIYDLMVKYLPVLKNKRFVEDSLHMAEHKKYDIVCIGFGETGKKIIAGEAKKTDTLIIDFDPTAIHEAKNLGFNVLYGDASDIETAEIITDSNPLIVISTIMDADSNATLLKKLKANKAKTNTIVLANTSLEAKKIKLAGADFVIVQGTIVSRTVKNFINDIREKKSFELSWLEKIGSDYEA